MWEIEAQKYPLGENQTAYDKEQKRLVKCPCLMCFPL